MPDSPTRDELFDEEFMRRLRHLAMAGRRVMSGAAGGAHRATDLGDGLEFADHRPYAPGDELRYVDWNVFGRLGRLQVRLFHRHSEQQIYLLLDASASMAAGRGGKEAFAKRIAAGLAYLAWVNLDHVSLAAWGGQGGELTPQRGRSGRFSDVLDFLAGAAFGGTCDMDASAKRFFAGRRKRGLAVLISDAADLEGLDRALRRIRHHGHQAAVLSIHSPADAGRVGAGPIALIDPEAPDAPIRATAEPDLLAAYREQWSRHQARAAATVRAVGGVHFSACSDESWERFLLTCLRRMRLAAV